MGHFGRFRESRVDYAARHGTESGYTVGGVSGYTRDDTSGVNPGVDSMEEAARCIIYLRDLPKIKQKNGKPAVLLRGKTVYDYVCTVMKRLELLSSERPVWTPVSQRPGTGTAGREAGDQ